MSEEEKERFKQAKTIFDKRVKELGKEEEFEPVTKWLQRVEDTMAKDNPGNPGHSGGTDRCYKYHLVYGCGGSTKEAMMSLQKRLEGRCVTTVAGITLTRDKSTVRELATIFKEKERAGIIVKGEFLPDTKAKACIIALLEYSGKLAKEEL